MFPSMRDVLIDHIRLTQGHIGNLLERHGPEVTWRSCSSSKAMPTVLYALFICFCILFSNWYILCLQTYGPMSRCQLQRRAAQVACVSMYLHHKRG